MSISTISHQHKSLKSCLRMAVVRQARLENAAEQFEAMFLQQILKQMRKAGDVLSEGSPLRSRQGDTLREFHDEALAEHLAGQRRAASPVCWSNSCPMATHHERLHRMFCVAVQRFSPRHYPLANNWLAHGPYTMTCPRQHLRPADGRRFTGPDCQHLAARYRQPWPRCGGADGAG